MTREEAVRIIITLLNRLTLNPAEAYAANEAVKALQAPPVAATEATEK